MKDSQRELEVDFGRLEQANSYAEYIELVLDDRLTAHCRRPGVSLYEAGLVGLLWRDTALTWAPSRERFQELKCGDCRWCGAPDVGARGLGFIAAGPPGDGEYWFREDTIVCDDCVPTIREEIREHGWVDGRVGQQKLSEFVTPDP